MAPCGSQATSLSLTTNSALADQRTLPQKGGRNELHHSWRHTVPHPDPITQQTQPSAPASGWPLLLSFPFPLPCLDRFSVAACSSEYNLCCFITCARSFWR